MEGGIGILLLLIIVALAGVVALYLTGGAILGAKGDKRKRSEAQPDHKKVENPENVEFVGTDRKD